MDRNSGAEQVGPATPAAEEHEIKVQTQSRIWNCVAYATTLLEENESNKIVLKAIGEAISRAVIIAESIKKKTAGLHQNTSIGTTDERGAWKPLEEDLLPSETTNNRSLMTITLSKKELDTSSPGYQSPVADDPMNLLREHDNGGHDGHGVHDGRWRSEGTEASDLNVNRGWDARCGYNRGWDAGRGRGRGRYQGFGRGYSDEICSDHGMGNVHQESGNIKEASDLSVNRDWDAGRGRGHGRYQAFQGRGRGYSGEICSDHGMENVHQQSGNISEAPSLSINNGWDAGRGRGRGRYQTFHGHIRASNGEIGSAHGMETVHQQSGNISKASGICVSSGWDSGRGRGRGRYQAFQGHRRGGYGEIGSDHNMENVHQESGNSSESSDHSVGRGWDSGYGRGRGHERDQAFQGQRRRYSGEIGYGYTGNMHQESGGQGVEFSGGYPRESAHNDSGNINGMPDLSLNIDWDARNDYAARGRGRGREQASQGRGRRDGVEFAIGYPRENLHQESGNINGVPNLGMNRVWDSRNGRAWSGGGRQRDQVFQGRGRGYTGGDYGNTNGDDSAQRGRDARHGYTGRARGRGRNPTLRGRGRAYNTEISDRYGRDNMHQESRGCGEQKEPATEDPVGQLEPLDNIGTSVTSQQVAPTIDNLLLDSTCHVVGTDIFTSPVNWSSDSDGQLEPLDNIGTPVPSQQVAPTIDNLLLDSTRPSFDSLGDDDISHIGSACGFVFSDSGVALVRLLERQRAKLGFT